MNFLQIYMFLFNIFIISFDEMKRLLRPEDIVIISETPLALSSMTMLARVWWQHSSGHVSCVIGLVEAGNLALSPIFLFAPGGASFSDPLFSFS